MRARGSGTGWTRGERKPQIRGPSRRHRLPEASGGASEIGKRDEIPRQRGTSRPGVTGMPAGACVNMGRGDRHRLGAGPPRPALRSRCASAGPPRGTTGASWAGTAAPVRAAPHSGFACNGQCDGPGRISGRPPQARARAAAAPNGAGWRSTRPKDRRNPLPPGPFIDDRRKLLGTNFGFESGPEFRRRTFSPLQAQQVLNRYALFRILFHFNK
jgi:hypothetical protein